jgi:magnesium transporter
MNAPKSEERLREGLEQVKAILARYEVLENLAHIQQGPKRDLLEALTHRQNLADLQKKVGSLHPADLAYVLEGLPPEERLLVFRQARPRQRGDVLVEVSAGLRDALLDATPREDLVALLREMDADDLAYLAESVPEDVRQEVYRSLDDRDASWVRSQAGYPDDSVGHLMEQDVLSVRDTHTIEKLFSELRARRALPRQIGAVYVVDARNVLRGALPIEAVLVHEPAACVADAMVTEVVTFAPEDKARQAAKAFERYDLVTAPVVDERGKLLGRLTVDAVVDFIRAQSEIQALRSAGLAGEEDLFAPAWASARNRWLWLAVNLVTAFLASRVIGAFEETIAGLVALATLMPIVASIGGNTGNQTVALMIRGLSLDQITAANIRHLLRKELTVSVLNGLVWGGVVGLLASLLYRNLPLGGVMAGAVLLNLIVSALVGVAVPLALHRAGRDPAQGASVLLTFTTDSMGFFIFLALARAFLI